MKKIKEDVDLHGVNISDYNLDNPKLNDFDLDKKMKGVQFSNYDLGRRKKPKDPLEHLKYDSETKIGNQLGLGFDILKNQKFREILRTLPGYKSTRKTEMQTESLNEKHLSDEQIDKREEIAKSMKSTPEKVEKLKKKYGENWKNVLYATATKLAMKESYDLDEGAMIGIETDTKKLKKFFSNLGWSLSRSSGDHEIWKHPKAKHHLSIPNHRDIKKPLAKTLIHQAQELVEDIHSREFEILQELFIDKQRNKIEKVKSKVANLAKPKTKNSENDDNAGAIKSLRGGRTLTGNLREPLHISPKINKNIRIK